MSVNTPIVDSDVVLTLLLTADTVLLIIRLSKDDFPALGAPKKHDLRDFAPSGESLQSKFI